MIALVTRHNDRLVCSGTGELVTIIVTRAGTLRDTIQGLEATKHASLNRIQHENETKEISIAIHKGTVVAVSDGSFAGKRASAAFTFRCDETEEKVEGTVIVLGGAQDILAYRGDQNWVVYDSSYGQYTMSASRNYHREYHYWVQWAFSTSNELWAIPRLEG